MKSFSIRDGLLVWLHLFGPNSPASVCTSSSEAPFTWALLWSWAITPPPPHCPPRPRLISGPVRFSRSLYPAAQVTRRLFFRALISIPFTAVWLYTSVSAACSRSFTRIQGEKPRRRRWDRNTLKTGDGEHSHSPDRRVPSWGCYHQCAAAGRGRRQDAQRLRASSTLLLILLSPPPHPPLSSSSSTLLLILLSPPVSSSSSSLLLLILHSPPHPPLSSSSSSLLQSPPHPPLSSSSSSTLLLILHSPPHPPLSSSSSSLLLILLSGFSCTFFFLSLSLSITFCFIFRETSPRSNTLLIAHTHTHTHTHSHTHKHIGLDTHSHADARLLS